MDSFKKPILLGLICVWLAQTRTPGQERLTASLRPVPSIGTGLRIDFDYRFERTPAEFDREPPSDPGQVCRGWIPTVPPTAFLRTLLDGGLLLDRDRDFVETPPDRYEGRFDPVGHVLFKGLQVRSAVGGVEIPYTVDLYTYERADAGWFVVRTAWTGGFEMDGGQWRLTVIDNLDGRLDSNDVLSLSGPNAQVGHCYVPKRLFFGGHLFDLEGRFQADGDGPSLSVSLTRQPAELGDLHLDLRGVASVRLSQADTVVLLETGRERVSIPVGRYRVDDCLLIEDPNLDGLPRFLDCNRTLTVGPGREAGLRLGTPLQNQARIERNRNLLLLNYALVGAGGERYEFCNGAGFSIFKGPFCIAHGNFGLG